MKALANTVRMVTLAACTALLLPQLSRAEILTPDHVVIVIMQDRFSDAIGHPKFDYLNTLIPSSLVYSNSHGVTHPSEPNSLALYTGSTQGITDNGRDNVFDPDTPNLGNMLTGAHFSFAGFSENLPEDGSQVSEAGDSSVPDLYTRNVNPMAQFTDVDEDDHRVSNPQFNKTFESFHALKATGNYDTLPTVSFVIPNAFHSTHGSNETEPNAGSPDEDNNDILRGWADDWLHDEIDPYLQWAKNPLNNSLLIITQDEERWTGGSSPTITTLINGDSDLFVAGVNGNYYNHYNLLRTLSDMYGFDPLGESANVSAFTINGLGQLTVPEPSSLALIVAGAALSLRRHRRARGKHV